MAGPEFYDFEEPEHARLHSRDTAIEARRHVQKGREGVTETENDRINIKPRYSLIPTDVLEAVATVLTYGAIKHDEDDFTHCTTRTEEGEFDALMRHWVAFISGLDADEETGYHPTVHMAARAIILCHLALREDS